MSTAFRERFDTLVQTLRADARIEVFAAKLGPPASTDALNKAESAVQRRLPLSMRAFYEAHNGAFLLWGLKGRKYPKLKPFEFPDYDAAPGCINLLPIEKAMSPFWQGESHLNEVDEDCWKALFGKRFQSFSKMAARLSFSAQNLDPDQAENDTSSRAFEDTLLKFDGFRVPEAIMLDLYSKNNMAALLLGPLVGRPADGTDRGPYQAEEPLVIRASDGGADMVSNGMSFPAYLDCLLASWGSHREGFAVDDDPARIERWEPEEAPTLESIIEAISDE